MPLPKKGMNQPFGFSAIPDHTGDLDSGVQPGIAPGFIPGQDSDLLRGTLSRGIPHAQSWMIQCLKEASEIICKTIYFFHLIEKK